MLMSGADWLFNMLGIKKEDIINVVEQGKQKLSEFEEKIDRIEKKLDAVLLALEDISDEIEQIKEGNISKEGENDV